MHALYKNEENFTFSLDLLIGVTDISFSVRHDLATLPAHAY